MPRLLLIDDDEQLGAPLATYLRRFEFDLQHATRPSEGLKRLRAGGFDAAILDVMLPEMDGFELCRTIRKESNIPIVMLTARGDVMDRVVGLELGADDYLPKPFEPRELLARIQSVLRRSEPKLKTNDLIKLKNFALDPNKRTAFYNGKDMELTSTEYELLLLFVKHNGKVLSRDEIMQNTRGISWMSFDRSVDVLVSRLRNKLKSRNRKEQVIKTVHSIGYMFFAEEESQ